MTELPTQISLMPDPDGFQSTPADLNTLPAKLHTLDLSSIDSKAELMSRLAHTFRLPAPSGTTGTRCTTRFRTRSAGHRRCI